jgi:hypothetical protein
VAAETAKAAGAGLLHRMPLFRELLPEKFKDTDIYGQPKFPERNAFIPDISLRGFTTGKPEIVWPEKGRGVLPKMMTRVPMVNPPDLPANDPYSAEIRAVERAVPERGKPISPPTVPQFRELENQMRMAGMPVKPMDRDMRAAILRAKGVTQEVMVKNMINSPQYQAPDDERHWLLEKARDLATQGSGRMMTSAMRGATMAPDQRQMIMQQLQDYIQMMQQQVPE